jgi:hypothetical protein
MNKYYTPSIEEFHVGFEYEYSDLNHNLQGYGWFKTEYVIDDTLLGMIEVGMNNYRVKYLDKEDIESLGFKLDLEAGKHSEGLWFKSTIKDILDGEDDYLVFYPKNNTITIGSFIAYEEQMLVSDINIKNKSELKRLLKQLGIYGDSTEFNED